MLTMQLKHCQHADTNEIRDKFSKDTHRAHKQHSGTNNGVSPPMNQRSAILILHNKVQVMQMTIC